MIHCYITPGSEAQPQAGLLKPSRNSGLFPKFIMSITLDGTVLKRDVYAFCFWLLWVLFSGRSPLTQVTWLVSISLSLFHHFLHRHFRIPSIHRLCYLLWRRWAWYLPLAPIPTRGKKNFWKNYLSTSRDGMGL